MATMTRVMHNAYVELDGDDYTEQTTEVELSVDVADEDVTTFAADGWTEVVGTRKSGKLDLGILLGTEIEDFFWTNMGDNVGFVVRPDDGAVSTSNPEYTGTVMVPGFKPVSGKVSDVARDKVSMKTSGPVERATES